VTYPPNGGGMFPPWVWSQSLVGAPTSWKIPGSDPSSAWHGMYQSGGPFTNHSQWDSNNAPMTAARIGGRCSGRRPSARLFAAPALAGLFGGGGAAGAASGAGPLAAGETGMAATDAAMAGSTVPASLSAATGGSGVGSALSGLAASAAGGKAINPIVGALTTLGSALGGRAIASATGSNNVPPQLSQLLDMAVQRQQQQQPLGQAVDQGMYQMLPNFAKTGTSMPNGSMTGLTSLFGGK
jgi:hypothetical protein